MPSTIGTAVGGADAGVTVAANYLKTTPSTQFATRRLSVINIAIADVFVDYALADSLYSKSVRALQQTAEVFAVFTPVDAGTDSFNAIIATHTQWAGDAASPQNGNAGQDGTGYGILETAIAAGNGGVAATVTNVAGFGQVAI
jgi:hypothetical protein